RQRQIASSPRLVAAQNPSVLTSGNGCGGISWPASEVASMWTEVSLTQTPSGVGSSWSVPAVDVGATVGAAAGGHQREPGRIDLAHACLPPQLQSSFVVVVEAMQVAFRQQA